MLYPLSFRVLYSGLLYKLPNKVEMFGLKAPLPKMISRRPT